MTKTARAKAAAAARLKRGVPHELERGARLHDAISAKLKARGLTPGTPAWHEAYTQENVQREQRIAIARAEKIRKAITARLLARGVKPGTLQWHTEYAKETNLRDQRIAARRANTGR